MRREPWMKEIREEDLPEPLDDLARKIGFDNLMTVLEYFDGGQVYFRRVKTALIHVRDRIIVRKWNGFNLRELAQEFDLTDRQVRNVLEDDPRQDEMFPGTNSKRKAGQSPT